MDANAPVYVPGPAAQINTPHTDPYVPPPRVKALVPGLNQTPVTTRVYPPYEYVRDGEEYCFGRLIPNFESDAYWNAKLVSAQSTLKSTALPKARNYLGPRPGWCAEPGCSRPSVPQSGNYIKFHCAKHQRAKMAHQYSVAKLMDICVDVSIESSTGIPLGRNTVWANPNTTLSIRFRKGVLYVNEQPLDPRKNDWYWGEVVPSRECLDAGSPIAQDKCDRRHWDESRKLCIVGQPIYILTKGCNAPQIISGIFTGKLCGLWVCHNIAMGKICRAADPQLSIKERVFPDMLVPPYCPSWRERIHPDGRSVTVEIRGKYCVQCDGDDHSTLLESPAMREIENRFVRCAYMHVGFVKMPTAEQLRLMIRPSEVETSNRASVPEKEALREGSDDELPEPMPDNWEELADLADLTDLTV
jgi:hypothetical protein